jgi:hypothetical protein
MQRWIWIGILGSSVTSALLVAGAKFGRPLAGATSAAESVEAAEENGTSPLQELRGKAPEFQQIAEWINTKPLQLKDLTGQVVAVNFWTFG